MRATKTRTPGKQRKTTPGPKITPYKKPPVPPMKAKVTSKGQITLPSLLRQELGVKPGDEVEFIEDHGVWRIRRLFDAEAFERALANLRGKIHPFFAGMTTDEIMEELRGPVDLD